MILSYQTPEPGQIRIIVRAEWSLIKGRVKKKATRSPAVASSDRQHIS
jgi:hypothetical protein